MTTYAQNPGAYLTQTACRRNLAGDVCAILRVHAFLEHWGLINAHTSLGPDGLPTGPVATTSGVPPKIATYLRASKDSATAATVADPVTTLIRLGEFNKSGLAARPAASVSRATVTQASRGDIYAATATDLAPAAGPASTAPAAAAAADGTGAAAAEPMDLDATGACSANATAAAAAEQHGYRVLRGRSYHCNGCDTDCTRLRYHCTRQADYDLCPKCFAEGKFYDSMSSVDFIKMLGGIGVGDTGDGWSDEETLLLLEALKVFGENWTEVAEHVSTKSKEQCILKFLRLPIEEPFLEDNVALAADPTKGAGPPTAESLQKVKDSLPFAETTNPVMALVAFLASAVSPMVAAAAAQAALTAFFKDGKEAEKEPNGVPVPPSASGNALAIDDVRTAAAAGLAAAALKAKLMADADDREIQRLVAHAVETQLKKLELKLQQFEIFEQILERERVQIEQDRQKLLSERVALAAQSAKLNSARIAASSQPAAAAAGALPSTSAPGTPIGGQPGVSTAPGLVPHNKQPSAPGMPALAPSAYGHLSAPTSLTLQSAPKAPTTGTVQATPYPTDSNGATAAAQPMQTD